MGVIVVVGAAALTAVDSVEARTGWVEGAEEAVAVALALAVEAGMMVDLVQARTQTRFQPRPRGTDRTRRWNDQVAINVVSAV